MALLQISKPGQSTAPHQHRLAAGIDRGTTNSLVASVLSGEAVTLADADGKHLLPSVVRYLADVSPMVGEAARQSASQDPQNTIISVKRFMGRGFVDVQADNSGYQFLETDSVPRLKTIAGDVSAIEVSAEILKALKQRAEQSLGGELSGVVITVPAYFDDAQRQATKDAARFAGLNVMRLLNEPTAAAVAYGLDRGSEGVHAIYDLGGGTFDISILRLNKGVFEVMAPAGDSALGGDDMDRAIVEWIASESGVDIQVPATFRQLMHEARAAKEALTDNDVATINIQVAGKDWQGELSREQFTSLVDTLIRKTLIPCRRALRDAGIELAEIEDVVMAGGSTPVSRVPALVGAFFKSEPLVVFDPARVVSGLPLIRAALPRAPEPGA